MFLQSILDPQKEFKQKIAKEKAKNMKAQCCTLSVFYVRPPGNDRCNDF